MSAKATFIMVCLLVISMISVETQATVTLNSGKVGFRLTNAGSLRLSAPSTSDNIQLGRVNIIAALSEEAVCDYDDDQDKVVDSYQITPPIKADVEAFAHFDNSYTDLPPDVRFKSYIYGWTNEPYLLVEYTVINDAAEEVTLYLGAVVVPQLSGAYGNETNKYDAATQTVYCYREGETPHAGIRLVSKEPYSCKILDWDTYSPNPDEDEATDSTRFHMTADTGFDTMLVTGVNGCMYSLNAGAYVLAAGDSTVFTYAVVYGDSANELFINSNAAKTRYDNALQVSKSNDRNVPATCSLSQNYPNPFNPRTIIEFNLSQTTPAKLTVYNIKGEVISVLVNESLSAGSYQIPFRATNLNSGIYLYRLETNGFSDIRKMTIIK